MNVTSHTRRLIECYYELPDLEVVEIPTAWLYERLRPIETSTVTPARAVAVVAHQLGYNASNTRDIAVAELFLGVLAGILELRANPDADVEKIILTVLSEFTDQSLTRLVFGTGIGRNYAIPAAVKTARHLQGAARQVLADDLHKALRYSWLTWDQLADTSELF